LTNFVFKDPFWLLAVLVIPLAIWLRGRRRVPVLVVPFAAAWHRTSFTSASRWPSILVSTGLTLFALGLARPQKIEDKREVNSQGYDIILAIDLSGSMLAEDYEKNGERLSRIQAIKPVIQAFINDRPNDRIGIVVFAGRAYTLAPLTFDHDWLARQTERLKIGLIEDGTAIGDGLGVALTRLEQAGREEGNTRKGAFVVLLTDGANNRGALTPAQATEIAKSRAIPVYTIGAGKDGIVPFPVMDESGRRIGTQRMVSDLDEGALRVISDETGGHYYRADDIRTIESAFRAIDKSAKIEFKAKSYLLTTELFPWLVVPGAVFLMAAGFVGKKFQRSPAATTPTSPAPPPQVAKTAEVAPA